MANKFIFITGAVVAISVAALFSIGSHHSEEGHQAGAGHDTHGTVTAEEFERGPHRGRLLRDGDFSLEIVIFEDGVPPQYHLYAFKNDSPLDPTEVQATIVLKRLDGEANTFQFTPKENYLDGGATVTEPHSFDVTVDATFEGKEHHWEFASYEGRVTITPEAAEAAGLKTEQAGPGIIREKISLTGRITL